LTTHPISLPGRHEARTRGFDFRGLSLAGRLVDPFCRVAGRLRGLAAAAAVVCVVVTAGVVALTLSHAAAPAPAVSSCRRAVAAADDLVRRIDTRTVTGDPVLARAVASYQHEAAACRAG
jgi:hypothetical protein